MKAALVAALFGALLAVSTACPLVPYRSCVQEEKPTKCTAVQVCADAVQEPCGDSFCQYPYVCANIARTECANFAAIQARCDPQRVCQEVKTPCGDGACNLNQDCVKETVCRVVSSGRKLLQTAKATAKAAATDDSTATADATALAKGDDANADADATALASDGSDATATSLAVAVDDDDDDEEGGAVVYIAPTYYAGCDSGCDDPAEQLVCEDTYTCVARDPCQEVVVKKCVRSELQEGIDVCHGGYLFSWAAIAVGERCGDEYCGYGFECADVVIQTCTTPCGDAECPWGYECVADEQDPDCEQYAYLATICQDVYEPVCVALSPYCLLSYQPPCQTVYQCEVEDAVCGGDYCPYGYVCAVDYQPSCSGAAYDPGFAVVVSPPEKCPAPRYTYVIQPTVPPTGGAGGAGGAPGGGAPGGGAPGGGAPGGGAPGAGGAGEDDDDDDTAFATSTSVADGDKAFTYAGTETTGDATADAGALAKTDDSLAGSGASSGPGYAETITKAFAEDGAAAKALADAFSSDKDDE